MASRRRPDKHAARGQIHNTIRHASTESELVGCRSQEVKPCVTLVIFPTRMSQHATMFSPQPQLIVLPTVSAPKQTHTRNVDAIPIRVHGKVGVASLRYQPSLNDKNI